MAGVQGQLTKGMAAAGTTAGDAAGATATRSFGRRFGAGVKRVAATAGKAGLIGAGFAAGTALVGGFQSAVDQQTGRKTLAGLYGSAREATEVMRGLREVSKSSPIDYSSYISAAQSLAYAGVQGQDAIGILKNVGLAITAAGGSPENMTRATDAILKMVNAGKVSLDSLQQLSDAGVPIISGLAKHFGVSMDKVNEMASGGKIGLQDVLSVMQNATGKTFQSMTRAGEAASKSFGNQWKIASDNVQVAIGQAMLPLLDALAPHLVTVGNAISAGIEKLPAIFSAIGSALGPLKGVIVPVTLSLLGLAAAIKGAQLASKGFGAIGRTLAAPVKGTMNLARGFRDVSAASAEGATGATKFGAAMRRVSTWIGNTARAAWQGAVRLAQLGAAYVRVGLQAAAGGLRTAGAYLLSIARSAGTAALSMIRLGLAYARAGTMAVVNAARMAALRTVQYGIAAATRAWAIAQRLLNLAMRANPIGVIITLLGALVAGVIYAWKNFEWFRDIVTAAWRGIQTAISWAWRTVIKPVFNALRRFVMGVLVPAFTWLWQNIIRPYWTAIARIIQWAWNNVIRPVFSALRAFVQNILIPVITWLWKNVVRPYWTAIARVIEWAWNNVIKPVFNVLRAGIRATGDAFGKFKRGVDSVWQGIKGAFKTGVNAVIGALNWMIGKLNKVLGVFGLEIPLIPKMATGGSLGDVARYASGGTIGSGFVTNGPTAIVGEGNPRYPEYVIPTDPRYRTRARRLHGEAGTDLMASGGRLGGRTARLADGGILGDIGNFFSDIGSGAWDLIKTAGGAVGNWLSGAWDLLKRGVSWAMDHTIRPILAAVKNLLPDSLLGRVGAGIVDKLYGGIRGWLTSRNEELEAAQKKAYEQMGAAAAAGAGAGRWRGVALKALAIMGQPASLVGTVLRRLQQESGGNPGIVNRWDINWQRGIPSVGLMQVIGPTYQAYKHPAFDIGPYKYGSSVNPLANMLASMRYAIATYGSLSAAYNRAGGYDNGGPLMPGQWAYNGTTRPENVRSGREEDAIVRALDRLEGRTGGDVSVRVFIGERELTDIVDTRVTRGQQATARALRAGRR